MSLVALADHMASKGRGGDSMLVHMSPEEVNALQALAQRHGKSLTINPETGQPEALSLKSLLPAIAGAALGPAGFGLFSSALTAGAAIGGVTALATGSLSRGLMAGLGAYGGANLASGLMGAGAGAAESAALSGLTQEQIAAQAASQGLTEQGVMNQAAADAAKEFSSKSLSERFSAGLGAAIDKPGDFLQGMGGPMKTFGAAYMAASPIMADQAVKTTTGMPSTTDTGNIRRFSYDPYNQTYTPLGIFPAAGYKGMAGGGIVALAEGGDPTQQIQDWWKANEGSGNQAALDKWLATSGYTAQQINTALPQLGVGDLNAAIKNAMAQQEILNRQEARAQLAAQNPGQDFILSTGTGQPNAPVFNPISAIPQSEIDAARAKLDPETANFVDWYTQQMNPMLVKRNADIFAGQGVNPYADVGYAKDIMARGNENSPWKDPSWREKLAAQEAADKAAKEKAMRDAANSPFVIGGGTGATTGAPAAPVPMGPIGGISDLRNAYTAGGGSLGQSNLFVPTNIQEFNQRYTNTGGSKQAYDYLMNKGAASITTPYTPTGEIARPYKEAVMGLPVNLATKPVIFDPVTRKYVPNPDYQKLSFDSQGNRIIEASTNQAKAALEQGQEAVQALVDAGTLTYSALAALTGKSIAEVEKLYPRKKTTPTNVLGGIFGSDGGGDSGAAADDGGGPDGVSAGDASAGEGGTGGGDGSGVGGGSATAAYGGYVQRQKIKRMALGGLGALAGGGQAGYNLGSYSDGGRLLRGPGDGVSDSIPATIGQGQPARLADGEFVVPARIVSELGNGSTEAGARKLYAMMDRVQRARGKTTGKGRVAKDTRAEKYLPA